MKFYKNNRGTALITALFMLTIVVIIATALIERLRIDIDRTQLLINKDKMYLALQYAKSWAIGVLSSPVIARSEATWQSPSTESQVSGDCHVASLLAMTGKGDMIIEGTLIDAQGFFNLNNLQDKDKKNSFILLLKSLPVNKTEAVEQLTDSLLYWLSAIPSDPAIEDSYEKNGYHVSHQSMSSRSELRLVRGFTAEIYHLLEPAIMTLPRKTAVNINTASFPVLLSLGMSKEAAEYIMHTRAELKGYKTLQQFYADEKIKKFNIPASDITVVSEYFLLQTKIIKNKQELKFYCLLERSENNNKKQVDIVWQRFNTL